MSEWVRAGITSRGARPPARSAARSLSAMAGEEVEESRLCVRKNIVGSFGGSANVKKNQQLM